jgi:DNA-cytosine methyltransferase
MSNSALAIAVGGRFAEKRQVPILLVEDNAQRSERQTSEIHSGDGRKAPVVVRLHKILGRDVEVISETSYKPGFLPRHPAGKSSIAFQLLDAAGKVRCRPVVVAGVTYGSNRAFLKGILERGFDCVVELRLDFRVPVVSRSNLTGTNFVDVSKLLIKATWKKLDIELPQLGRTVQCLAAELGSFRLTQNHTARIFAVNVGAIKGVHRGIMIGATTVRSASLPARIRSLYWARGIRPLVRRRERGSRMAANLVANPNGTTKHNALIQYRSNVALAQIQDKSHIRAESIRSHRDGMMRGLLGSGSRVMNVVELFSGAGGMGLGFLMAKHGERRFRLVFSGEIHRVYVETLGRNHEYFAGQMRSGPSDPVPETVQPVDLRARRSLEHVVGVAREAGGIDVLIGGPPCRGFSNANRNSWSRDNPHNDLVNVFMRYVERLNPPVFLMENVQGIGWTAANGNGDANASVVDHVLRRMRHSGYLVFPKLLDAVWYGVPQYRTRFFVLGIRKDIGYRAEDFGPWGPFPVPTHGPAMASPYITVRDAIVELPRIGNGQNSDELAYEEPTSTELENNHFLRLMRRHAPKNRILDHITSRHADYVIERYKQIPAGGNWESIAKMMSNYADVERTHSNIYRRLVWDQPSITIGHYRKSMLVHPGQNRGLSLREAARLQSFPDWFRFAGAVNGAGGLIHKQQQLANAVCPLVTKAIAEFLLTL